MTACSGCGARLPLLDGPAHRYIGGSAACWALYGELGYRETASLGLAGPERLSVHVYLVQDPGVVGPQSAPP